MLGNLGSGELIIIGILLLVFFGSKKLNELARGLGQSSKELKKMQREFNQEVSLEEPDEEVTNKD
jgi:sec-independent protein translocase protein TatA